MGKAFPPFGTKKPAAGEVLTGTTINASTWRWDGNSGSVLVSSGFPVKPGQVTAATVSQVRVYVNSVEQAVAIHPLEGTFPDGSYRSVGIQFTYTLTNNTPVTSEVRVNAGARGTGDIAWTEPVLATVAKKAVIAPTDPAHLCGTCFTLTPLTPASNDSGAGALWASAIATRWTDTGVANGAIAGGAIYDHQNGLWNLYCRTGTRSWYQYAYDWCTEMTGGSIINSASDLHLLIPYGLHTTPGLGCTNEAIWNPEGLTGSNGSCGQVFEPYGLRLISLASAYWITAWRQPKRNLARYANNALYSVPSGYATARDVWIDDYYGIRFNFAQTGLIAIVAGYLTECTTSFTTPGGTPGPGTYNYATWLPWTIDALYDTRCNAGDYRDGLVGMRDTPGMDLDEGGETGITNFQLAISAEYLMMYYDFVYPDSRIPTMMQTIADYFILQSRQSTTGSLYVPQGLSSDIGYPDSWVSNYRTHAPPLPATPYLAPYYIAMMPAMFAWVYAYTANSTYLTWADRAAAVGNIVVGTSVKVWGETFGGFSQAYLYYRNGGTIRGTTGVHPTVITEPPAHASLG